MDFLQKIATAIRRDNLLREGERVLVALSGGADSVALLFALRALGYDVVAAHCNFHLRGEESDRDENFVRQLCFRESISLEVTHFSTEEEAQRRGVSIEMAARDLRYAWFSELLLDKGIRRVAVAHHREDNAETFLLNLVRGTGLRGLCGMRPLQGHVVRPLLPLSRKEIERWLQGQGFLYVQDSTNTDIAFKRNRVRHRLMPLLREFNPSVDDAIDRTIRHLRGVEQRERRAMAETLSNAIILPDGIALQTEYLKKNPSAEPLLHFLTQCYGFPPTVAEDIFAHMDISSGEIYETETHLATRTLNLIEIRRKPMPLGEVKLRFGKNLLPDGTLLTVRKADLSEFSKKRYISCIDAEKVHGALICRRVRKGDRFAPFGMRGSKLISDYLADRGYSRIERMSKLVVCDRQNILWVVGERTAGHCAITPETRQMIRIELER